MQEAWIKLIIIFPIIIGLIYVSLKYSQTFINQTGGKRFLQVIEQLRVSPKGIVSIVKVGESYLLIGSTDEQVTLLKELTPEEVNAMQPNAQSLQTMNAFDAAKHIAKLKEQWKK
ncbi:MAG TPA: flagellar biosynthetic protein FliO [Firmicutes bacterium]|nr:flagellar biosynthetic protein FliO [Bacillota bacterium]